MTDDRLVRVLAYVADHAAAHGTMVSSQSACDACVDLVEASGAGLTLMNGAGRGESRYATDTTGQQLEQTQFTLGEGPSMDVFRSAVPVLVPELDARLNHRRWPLFTPAAVDIGVQAIFAFPLRAGAVRLGVLVLHRTRLGTLTPGQVADTLTITEVILSLLLDELIPAPLDPWYPAADRIRLDRTEIHQATGMLSVQLGVAMDAALARLRAYAFVNDVPIDQVARDVVARRLRMEPDPA